MAQNEDIQRFSDLDAEEQVKTWHGRIELAIRFRDRHGNTDGRWDDNVKALAGDFNSVSELGEEAIDVNMTRSMVKTTLPPMWIAEPRMVIVPTTPSFETKSGQRVDNVANSEKTEIEINYWMRELKVRHQVRKAMLDGEATNHGYIFVGHATKKQAVADNSPQVRAKRPFVRRLPPKDVLVPPGYFDLEDCPWVAVVFRYTPEEIWDLFSEDVAKSIPYEQGFSDHEDEKTDSTEFREFLGGMDAKIGTLFQVWCKKSKRVYWLARGHDEFLEEPRGWPYQLDGFPVCHYRPEEVPDEYHATPPLTYSMPQQKERNAIRTAMRKRRMKTKSTVFVDKTIEQETREAWASSEDGAIIPIDPGDSGNIRNMVMTDPGLPFDQGDMVYDSIISGDFRESMGQSANQRGVGDPNVDSATESATIQRGVQIRQSEKGDRVADLYINIGRKLWMVLKQFPNQERSRRIAGSGAGIFTTVTYTLDELQGEFDFRMDFAALLADNPANRQALAMTNYNLLRADPLINPEQLLLDVFASQNKQNPEAYLLTLRNPQQELDMMLKRLPVEAHDRDDHMAHIEAHDGQADRLDEVMRRLGPESDQGTAMRATMMLMEAHIQDHVAKLQRLVQQQGGGKPPGSPVAENQLRGQLSVASGSETAAEVGGQPLDKAPN